ncbi:MAG: hypothetical protein ABEJ78_01725 [Haloferacaceae archaeon]
MDLPQAAVDDLRVAAVAAVCTVALTLALRFAFQIDAPVLARLSPLFVYFGYLFFGKGNTGSVVERPRLWELLTVLATLGTLAYYLV